MTRSLPKHEAKHKVGRTTEVGAHRHEERNQVWGASVPRDTKVDECMGSFGRKGPQRGASVRLGTLVREGARHTQRTRRFAKVTFGVHTKEQGRTTKKTQGREKDRSQGSAVDLDKEGKAPSRSQVTPHGRSCATLR
jgi:hypothetical protein